MSQRKKYSKEFKIDAINLVQVQGYSCSEAAKSLDIPYDHLSNLNVKVEEDGSLRNCGKEFITPPLSFID